MVFYKTENISYNRENITSCTENVMKLVAEQVEKYNSHIIPRKTIIYSRKWPSQTQFLENDNE